jgi:HAMP domain-containing protein
MARTLDQIVIEQLGALMLQSLRQQTELEDLRERVKAADAIASTPTYRP